MRSSDDQFLAQALAELERVTRKALGGEAGNANSFASSARGVGRSPTEKALGGEAPDEQLTVRLDRACLALPPKVVTTWSLTGGWSFEAARD